MKNLNYEQQVMIHKLRQAGYAVTVWSPEELEGVNPRDLEEAINEYVFCDFFANLTEYEEF